MNIGIGLKKTAYTPEAYAYYKYLTKKGLNVQLEDESKLDLNNDINIYIMGMRPFWKRYQGKALEIHEYQSLSTAPMARAKDLLKKYTNKRPIGRIFLNNIVQDGISFNDNVPFIYRDMGVDSELFQSRNKNQINYDIVYSGSIQGRVGLIDELLRLSEIGFKVLIIGEVENIVLNKFSIYKNVEFTGRVKREELPNLYSQCRAGLNFTPDIYPFNIQTSTKTLEYLASGLTLVSNKYKWIEDFSRTENIEYIDSSSILTIDDLNDIKYEKDFREYEWENILEKSKLYGFIKGL